MSEKGVVERLQRQAVQMDTAIRQAFSSVKDEFEDHLIAINENTDECKVLTQSLNDLDQKVERLNARVDELQLLMRELLLEKIEITTLDDGKTMKLSQFY